MQRYRRRVATKWRCTGKFGGAPIHFINAPLKYTCVSLNFTGASLNLAVHHYIYRTISGVMVKIGGGTVKISGARVPVLLTSLVHHRFKVFLQLASMHDSDFITSVLLPEDK